MITVAFSFSPQYIFRGNRDLSAVLRTLRAVSEHVYDHLENVWFIDYTGDAADALIREANELFWQGRPRRPRRRPPPATTPAKPRPPPAPHRWSRSPGNGDNAAALGGQACRRGVRLLPRPTRMDASTIHPCGHVACDGCLEEWASKSAKCPRPNCLQHMGGLPTNSDGEVHLLEECDVEASDGELDFRCCGKPCASSVSFRTWNWMRANWNAWGAFGGGAAEIRRTGEAQEGESSGSDAPGNRGGHGFGWKRLASLKCARRGRARASSTCCGKSRCASSVAFRFVGLTEQWDDSLRLFHCALGGDAVASEALNTRPAARAHPPPSMARSDRQAQADAMAWRFEPIDGAVYRCAQGDASPRTEHAASQSSEIFHLYLPCVSWMYA